MARASLIVLALFVGSSLADGDLHPHGHPLGAKHPEGDHSHAHPVAPVAPAQKQQGRRGRQEDHDHHGKNGLIDFSNAVLDEETGKMCVIKESEVQSLEKEPILECTHKNVEKCHYTYVTQFEPAQEEVCEENFEKTCQITFKQQAQNETQKKCYHPLVKTCNGQGEEVCRTLYESSCTTRYIEKQPGKFVGDTKCEKLPIEICGAGCVTEEGPEECHDKTATTLIDVPEESCDLNPQKTCRLQSKLVPKLKPTAECTVIPQEVCSLRFNTPELKKKPLKTKWCLDDSPVVPGEIYDESNAEGEPLTSADSASVSQSDETAETGYTDNTSSFSDGGSSFSEGTSSFSDGTGNGQEYFSEAASNVAPVASDNPFSRYNSGNQRRRL